MFLVTLQKQYQFQIINDIFVINENILIMYVISD